VLENVFKVKILKETRCEKANAFSITINTHNYVCPNYTCPGC